MANSSHPGRVGGEQAARGRGDGSGGNRGEGQGGRGGGSFGGGPSGRSQHPGRIGGEQAARASNQSRGAAGGGTGNGGRGGGTFVGGSGTTRDAMQTQDQVGANVAAAQNDFNDVDNSTTDDIGNMIASFLGFNEQNPTEPGFSGPGMPGQTGRANWGFDPAGLIGGAAGMGFGIPLTGFLADQASALMGRPLEISLGPDVFGSDTIDPETGQVVGNSTTYSGPSMTLRDNDDPNEYFGTSPALGYIGNQTANAVPGKRTMTGVDPSPVDGAPADGYDPVTPNPSPIEEAPSGMNIDPGNTGQTPQQLSELFSGFMQPQSRTAKGKNQSRVVV
jgi:hypothetical protein